MKSSIRFRKGHTGSRCKIWNMYFLFLCHTRKGLRHMQKVSAFLLFGFSFYGAPLAPRGFLFSLSEWGSHLTPLPMGQPCFCSLCVLQTQEIAVAT
jgi:hypothetical protein